MSQNAGTDRKSWLEAKQGGGQPSTEAAPPQPPPQQQERARRHSAVGSNNNNNPAPAPPRDNSGMEKKKKGEEEPVAVARDEVARIAAELRDQKIAVRDFALEALKNPGKDAEKARLMEKKMGELGIELPPVFDDDDEVDEEEDEVEKK